MFHRPLSIAPAWLTIRLCPRQIFGELEAWGSRSVAATQLQVCDGEDNADLQDHFQGEPPPVAPAKGAESDDEVEDAMPPRGAIGPDALTGSRLAPLDPKIVPRVCAHSRESGG